MEFDVLIDFAKPRPLAFGFLNPVFPKDAMTLVQHCGNPFVGLDLGHGDQRDVFGRSTMYFSSVPDARSDFSQ